ncbi:conserved hypothetical protein [Neospora caninum Liverpool]|uniref:Septin n=1 Tax=Neospora caninum (strain Liverpool) TaxID=572307 RepID=F0VML7_NEOCL|nr:conserved hypothetical protein [Neospora caninum Liverpool]CBZ54963.1 conserved hypothetical protein [Neospora caninum Liverpool]|eukprot:XP_003884991.1 conserved hypothetical protein [Neospora caninum Liverpool]
MFPVFWRTRRPPAAPRPASALLPSSDPPTGLDSHSAPVIPVPDTSANSPVCPAFGGVSVPSGPHGGSSSVQRRDSRSSSLIGEGEGGVGASAEDSRGVCWLSSVGSVPSISGLDSNASSPPVSHGHSEPDADSNESPSDVDEAIDQLHSASSSRPAGAEHSGQTHARETPFRSSPTRHDGVDNLLKTPGPEPEGAPPSAESVAAVSSPRAAGRPARFATPSLSLSHSCPSSDAGGRGPEASRSVHASSTASRLSLEATSSGSGGDFCVVERNVGGTGSAAWVASGEGAGASPSASRLQPSLLRSVTPPREPHGASRPARPTSKGEADERKLYINSAREESRVSSGMGDSDYVVEPPLTYVQMLPESRSRREDTLRFFPLPKQCFSQVAVPEVDAQSLVNRDDTHLNRSVAGTTHATWLVRNAEYLAPDPARSMGETGEGTTLGSWRAMSPSGARDEAGISDPRLREALSRPQQRGRPGEPEGATPPEPAVTALHSVHSGAARTDTGSRRPRVQPLERDAKEEGGRTERGAARTVAHHAEGNPESPAAALSGSWYSFHREASAGDGLSHGRRFSRLSPPEGGEDDAAAWGGDSLPSVRRHTSSPAASAEGGATGLVQAAVLLWEGRLQQQVENSPRREGTPRDASHLGSLSPVRGGGSQRGRSVKSIGSPSPRCSVRDAAIGTSDGVGASSGYTPHAELASVDPRGNRHLQSSPPAVPGPAPSPNFPVFSRWGGDQSLFYRRRLLVGTDCGPSSVLQLLLPPDSSSVSHVNHLVRSTAEEDAGSSGRSGAAAEARSGDKSEFYSAVQPGVKCVAVGGVGDSLPGQMAPAPFGCRYTAGLAGPTRGLSFSEPARNIALNDFSSVSTILSEVQECESTRDDGNGARQAFRTALLRQVQSKLEKQCKRRFLGKTHRFNILLTGEGQSGKTTLLNEMFSHIHVVLWLLKPAEGTLCPKTVLMLRRLRMLCCVFPVLSMSDTVDVSRLGRYRARLHVELTGAGISPPHEWLFGEGAAAPSFAVEVPGPTSAHGCSPSPGSLCRPGSQASQNSRVRSDADQVLPDPRRHPTRDMNSTWVGPILQLPWVGPNAGTAGRAGALPRPLTETGCLPQAAGVAKPSRAHVPGLQRNASRVEDGCEASSCQFSQGPHRGRRDGQNSGENSQGHDRSQQSSDGGSGGSDDSNEKNPSDSSPTPSALGLDAGSSPIGFRSSGVARDEKERSRDGRESLGETKIGCGGCTCAEREDRLGFRGRGVLEQAGKASSTKDSDSLPSRFASGNSPAESPCSQGSASPVRPVAVLDPSGGRPLVQDASAVSSLESLGASSGWMASVHRSALAFPLLLDCSSSFLQHDTRYGYPRFEGVPPSSPAFLRLLLVEGSALLLLDAAKEKCFSPFYKLFWSREEAQQLNKKNALTTWQQHQAPALRRLDHLRLLLTELRGQSFRQGVATQAGVGELPGFRHQDKPSELDRSKTGGRGGKDVRVGPGTEREETREKDDSVAPGYERCTIQTAREKTLPHGRDDSERKRVLQEARQLEIQIRRLQQQIEVVQREQREKQARVLERQLEKQHEDTGLTWPDEEETRTAKKDSSNRRGEGELGGVVLQVTQMGLVSAVMVGVGALIFTSIKKGG